MENYKNKVAIITGSAGGLGKEFARRLLDKGCNICISDINEQLGEQTKNEFSEIYGDQQIHFVKCDVRRQEDVRNLFKQTKEHFNVDQIDLLVNNAGVTDSDKFDWKLITEINYMGVMNGTTIAMEEMSKTGGTVINVASILGLFCAGRPKGWAYNSSKSAVVSATRCMAAAMAEKSIRIMCLCPSIASTPILNNFSNEEIVEMKQNVGGFMTPEQVGDAFIKLLSDGTPGCVAAVWKDCAPYYIPDTGMATFIACTTCAMMSRLLPKQITPNVIRPFPHMLICACLILLLNFFLFKGIALMV